jgi:Uma2 family endonuclease
MSTTLAVPGSPPQHPLGAGATLYRLSTEQYEAMARGGILTERDRVELIQGLLVTKMTRNPPHTVSVRAVFDIFSRLVRPGYFSTKEDPIRIPGHSEPEPDVAVVRGESRDYKERHPEPSEILLVVEVSDSTLEFDRTTKQAIYASAKIAVYWIVNLIDRCLEVYSEPKGGRYRKLTVLEESETVAVVIDGSEIGQVLVADLLP